ncbi:MAG: DUF397 domain-containing protein [Umezawaea sp.]
MKEAITVSTVDFTGAVWRKSSRSGSGNNGACVEVTWRKSSRSSGANNSACVEVAFTGPLVAVRDSKNTAAGILAFPESSWAAFLASRT